MDLGLKGKRAMITAASKGVGRAAAYALAQEGADIAICSRSKAIRCALGLENSGRPAGGSECPLFLQLSDSYCTMRSTVTEWASGGGDATMRSLNMVFALWLFLLTTGSLANASEGSGTETAAGPVSWFLNQPEAPMEILEYARWKGIGGRWETSDGRSYHAGMRRFTAPLLALSGAADRNDPPKGCRELMEESGSTDLRFVLLGRKNGFSMDYGHVEMVVSKAAQKEVWPLIAKWLDERRFGPPISCGP